MKNCLVTKLKANLNREDLPVFGALRLYLESVDGVYPNLKEIGKFVFNGVVKFKFDDSINQFTNSSYGNIGSEISLNTESNVYVRIYKAGWLSISPKYGMIEIRNSYNKGIHYRVDDFKSLNDITWLDVENCSGDIKKFDINKDITRLSLNCQPSRGYKEGTTYGDIANLNKYTKLQTLSIANSSIKGNIEDLYPLVETTEINISNCKEVFGDIKILADKMYQAGRRSGTLKIWTAGQHGSHSENVTYNGEYFTNRVWTIVFSEDGHSDENTTE